MRGLFVVCLSALVFTSTAFAFDVPSKPTGYVNDYANILSEETKQGLEKELANFSASTTNEIAVVTVQDLGGVSIEEYAGKLFDAWKIGKEKQDNGVLFLIAPNDRTARIEVGYGLEGALPDILAKDILNTKVFPEFKNSNYNLGILQGVTAIAEATKGEYKAEVSVNNKNFVDIIVVAFIFGIQLLAFFVSILGRSKSWYAGGIFGGVVGVIITIFHIWGITFLAGSIITFVFVVLGSLFDYVVSNSYHKAVAKGGGIPWWVGGGNGGGFSSGGRSSFGGFGGGSSGGGGASGSW